MKKVKGLLVFRSCWTPLKNDFRVVLDDYRVKTEQRSCSLLRTLEEDGGACFSGDSCYR